MRSECDRNVNTKCFLRQFIFKNHSCTIIVQKLMQKVWWNTLFSSKNLPSYRKARYTNTLGRGSLTSGQGPTIVLVTLKLSYQYQPIFHLTDLQTRPLFIKSCLEKQQPNWVRCVLHAVFFIRTQFFEVRLSVLIFCQFSASNVLNPFLFL